MKRNKNITPRQKSSAAVVYAFNPSTGEMKAGGSLEFEPAKATKLVPRQPGLHKETPSQKLIKKINK